MSCFDLCAAKVHFIFDMCKKITKIFAIFSLEEVFWHYGLLARNVCRQKNKHFGLENKFSRKTLAYVHIFLYLCAFFCKAKEK